MQTFSCRLGSFFDGRGEREAHFSFSLYIKGKEKGDHGRPNGSRMADGHSFEGSAKQQIQGREQSFKDRERPRKKVIVEKGCCKARRGAGNLFNN